LSYDVRSREELKLMCEDDIVIVRRRVQAQAREIGLDTFATAAVTTAVSELSRNTWVHGGGGMAVVEVVEADDGRAGIHVSFRDEGPGIDDVDRVLRGGFSTTRTLGLGVSGSRRLVDEFDIDSTPGHGTLVSITKWTRFLSRAGRPAGTRSPSSTRPRSPPFATR
jgi:serine/threonine-protein kinase RsbT